jgi:glycosyltransferase involved in cell wall biosynthesis
MKDQIMQPLVSILIPCYNAERWIAQAIESALAQAWVAKEVIVVDDGSTDRSLEIIQSFGDRIYSEACTRRGGNGARNRLLELARGQWVQYLDADDYLLPKKISGQMDFLVTHPDADVVFGPVTLEHWSEHGVRRKLLQISEPHDLWALLARWQLPQTGASLWRKRAIVDVGRWKPDQPCCQEHELYLRLLMAGKHLVYCAANGAIYRQWSTETVCNQNTLEVNRRRLEIEQRLEDHLRRNRQLTAERLRAINETRFRIARSAWQEDQTSALAIMSQVQTLEPEFSPTDEVATARYQLSYRLLGFRTSERLADLARKLTLRFITCKPKSAT